MVELANKQLAESSLSVFKDCSELITKELVAQDLDMNLHLTEETAG